MDLGNLWSPQAYFRTALDNDVAALSKEYGLVISDEDLQPFSTVPKKEKKKEKRQEECWRVK